MTAAGYDNSKNDLTRAMTNTMPASSGEMTLYLHNFRDIDGMVENCWNMIRQEVNRHGFGPEEVKIHIALAEALINAWKHGNRRRPDLPIFFRWVFAGNFTFEVRDAGNGFNYHALPDPTNGEKLTAENGRGIFIIKTFARSVSWRDQGRHLIVTFSLS